LLYSLLIDLNEKYIIQALTQWRIVRTR
jgi:hypothetical protein